jgi:hypothetical protein
MYISHINNYCTDLVSQSKPLPTRKKSLPLLSTKCNAFNSEVRVGKENEKDME